jgi:hypothetical protein
MTVLEDVNNNNTTTTNNNEINGVSEALSTASKSNTNDEEKKKKAAAAAAAAKQASTTETLSFVFTSGPKTVLIFFCGVLGGIGNGVVRSREGDGYIILYYIIFILPSIHPCRNNIIVLYTSFPPSPPPSFIIVLGLSDDRLSV